jgi:hypothetical protein
MTIVIDNEQAYDAAIRRRIEANTLIKWNRFQAMHTEVDWVFAEFSGTTFIRSLITNGQKYGKLSEKQLACIVKWAATKQERDNKREEDRTAEREALIAAGVVAPAGRTTVTGVVLSMREQESDFGMVWKMLFRSDEGFKVWCSVPRVKVRVTVENPMWYHAHTDSKGRYMYDSFDKGDRVEFSVNLTPSADDVTFAFGSRPTKAVIIEKAVTTEEEI